jgi:hypothetical protein
MLDFYGSELGPAGGSYEHGNEPLGSVKRGEFLKYRVILVTSQGRQCSVELVS